MSLAITWRDEGMSVVQFAEAFQVVERHSIRLQPVFLEDL
jgi:hypothetical protein